MDRFWWSSFLWGLKMNCSRSADINPLLLVVLQLLRGTFHYFSLFYRFYCFYMFWCVDVPSDCSFTRWCRLWSGQGNHNK